MFFRKMVEFYEVIYHVPHVFKLIIHFLNLRSVTALSATSKDFRKLILYHLKKLQCVRSISFAEKRI